MYLNVVLRGGTENAPNKAAPQEFLSWAEKDLGMGSKRGRGNALSNIKKALDSRLDEMIGKTHLRFTKDWVPRRIGIREKLKIVGKLGVSYGAIVSLINSLRNKYEHEYAIPELHHVAGFLDAAQLWIEKSYMAYDFDSLAFINLPLTGLGSASSSGGIIINRASFRKPTQVVLCFFNPERALLNIHPDGTIKSVGYNSFAWEEMLNLEAPHIRRCHSVDDKTSLSQATQTDLLERYKLWLKTSLAAG